MPHPTCRGQNEPGCLASHLSRLSSTSENAGSSTEPTELSNIEACSVCSLSRERIAMHMQIANVFQQESITNTFMQPAMQLRCPHCGEAFPLAMQPTVGQVTCTHCQQAFGLIDSKIYVDDSTAPRDLAHFQLLEAVGSGGFGTVWRAKDKNLDRTVAIKIPRQGSLSPRDVEKFFDEARAAAQLQHPRIVAVHEIGRDNDTIYIVSDFIQGPILSDVLKQGALGVRQAVNYGLEIADGLAHAHQRGIIHRDLKPGNIGIDASGMPVIMDFGLARRMAVDVTMTIDGKIMGTPAYMSPEQAMGDSHTADARSDIYSLGVILFEMLTGERPFRGSTRMLLNQVIHDDPPSPRRLNGAIPKDLETIVLKCLEKSPSKRYASATEVSDELRRWQRNEPIVARPITRLERSWRWIKRNPTTSSLGTALFVSLTLGLVGTLWMWSNAVKEKAVAQQTSLEYQRQSSNLLFERGRDLCYTGQPSQGVHWLAQSLMVLPQRSTDAPRREILTENFYQWFAQIPKVEAQWDCGENITAMALFPDGKELLLGTDRGKLQRWSIEDNQPRDSLIAVPEVTDQIAKINSIAIDRSGTKVFLGSGRASTEFSRGSLVRLDIPTLQSKVLVRTAESVSHVRFNPDYATIAVHGGARDSKVWLFPSDTLSSDANPTTEVHGIQVTDQVVAGSFAPDGNYFLCITRESKKESGGLLIIEVSENALIPWEKPTLIADLEPTALDIAPDGKNAVVAFGDLLCEFEVPSMKLLRSTKTDDVVRQIAFAPTSSRFVIGKELRQAEIYDAIAFRPLASPLGFGRYVAWSSDGDRLFQAHHSELFTWYTPGVNSLRAVLPELANEEKGPNRERTRMNAYLGNGKYGIYSTGSGSAQILDIESMLPIHPPLSHPLPQVRCEGISPDGRFVVTSCNEKSTIRTLLRIWDLETGTPVTDWMNQRNWISTACFSPDSKWFAVGDFHNHLQLFDLENLQQPPKTAKLTDILCSVTFSQDSQHIAVGLTNDRSQKPMVVLLNASDLEPIGEPQIEKEVVRFVRFTPDGKRVVSLNDLGEIHLYDASSNKLIEQLETYQQRYSAVAMHPYENRILTGNEVGELRYWDLDTGILIWKSNELFPGVYINCIQFNQDGSMFAVAFGNGATQRYDTHSRIPVGPPHIARAPVSAVKFIDDSNRWLFLNNHGQLRSGPMRIAADAGSIASDTLRREVESATATTFDPSTQSINMLTQEDWLALQAHPASPNATSKTRDKLAPPQDAIKGWVLDVWEDGQSQAVSRIHANLGSKSDDHLDWERIALAASVEAGELRKAESLLTNLYQQLGENRTPLTDWFRIQATRHTASRHWKPAQWYFTKLLDQYPNEWQLWRDRGNLFAQAGDSASAESDRMRALALEPDDQFRLFMAKQRSSQAQWKEARDLYSSIQDMEVLSFSDMDGMAAAAVLAGDMPLFQRTCKTALDRASSRPIGISEANVITFFCRYAPLSDDDSQRAIALVQRIIGSHADSSPIPKGLATEILGWLHLRAGRPEDALEQFNKALELIRIELTPIQIGKCIAYGMLGDSEQYKKLSQDLDIPKFAESQENAQSRDIIFMFFNEMKDYAEE